MTGTISWLSRQHAREHSLRVAGAISDIPKSNIATKSPHGYMDVGSHSADRNTHFQMAVEAHFDAVRVGLMNSHTSDVTGVKAAVGVQAAAGNHGDSASYNPDTWVDVTWSTASSTTLGLGTATRPTRTVSDWMKIQSLARTDGGSLPILHLRIYQPAANANVSKLSPSGIETWLQTDTRFIRAYQKDGSDMIATKANFTTPTTATRWPPFFVQYMVRGAIKTIFVVGDSITLGTGASSYWNSHWRKLQTGLSNSDNPIELANFGWSGQTSAQYNLRAVDLLADNLISPGDLLVYQPFSPNNVASAASLATMNTNVELVKYETTTLLKAAFDKRVLPIITTACPVAASSRDWSLCDSARVALNQVLLDLPRIGVLDIAKPVSAGSASNGQVVYASGMSTDGLHPNDTGIDAMVAEIREQFEYWIKAA